MLMVFNLEDAMREPLVPGSGPSKSGFMADEERRLEQAIRDAMKTGAQAGPVSEEHAPAILKKHIEKLFPHHANVPRGTMLDRYLKLNASARAFCHTIVTECGQHGDEGEIFQSIEAVRNAVFFATESLRLGNGK